MADDKQPAPRETPPPKQPERSGDGKPDDTAGDKAGDKAGEKAEEKPAAPEESDRDTAVRNLQNQASELSQARMGEFVSRGISQLNAETINIFSGAYEEEFAEGLRKGRRPSRVTFTEQELDEATTSFVEPPGFAGELDLLADRNLVVLAGPARTGKRTRALRLLRTTLRESGFDEVVDELPASLLANATWRVPRERTGFVVFDAPGRGDTFTAGKISEEWLQKTALRLVEAESYLVVVTGPVTGSLADAPNRAEFVLDEWELPDSLEILHRRLRDTVPSEAEDLIARLADTELGEVLAERDSPAFAVRAAKEIVEGHRAGRGLTDTVARLGSADGLVHEWLSRDPEPKDFSLVLATAVLDGAGYLKVADAAVALYKRLSGSPPLSLQYARRLLAEHGWIQLVPSEDPRRAPTIRFRHARVRPAVLGVVWSTYDGAREKVLAWLRHLAEHSDVEVRAGAAQAIGILAQQDFQHSVHGYLQPWGRDSSLLLRQTAAQGLNVAGVLGNDQKAWSLLEDWAEAAYPENTENLCTTAALAAGGPLGIREPWRALGVLRDFVTCPDKWDVLSSVAASAGALLGAGLAACPVGRAHLVAGIDRQPPPDHQPGRASRRWTVGITGHPTAPLARPQVAHQLAHLRRLRGVEPHPVTGAQPDGGAQRPPLAPRVQHLEEGHAGEAAVGHQMDWARTGPDRQGPVQQGHDGRGELAFGPRVRQHAPGHRQHPAVAAHPQGEHLPAVGPRAVQHHQHLGLRHQPQHRPHQEWGEIVTGEARALQPPAHAPKSLAGMRRG